MARILVIDDEAPLRETLALALVTANHRVDQAADGKRALDFLRANAVDLVITDLVMPDQDGFETIMALRHLFPALPVIAMSGAWPSARLYLDIAARLGVRRTLAKPFTVGVLLNAIDDVLERVGVA